LKTIVRSATLGIGLSFIVGCAATSDKPGRKLILPDAPGTEQTSIYVGEGFKFADEGIELEIEEIDFKKYGAVIVLKDGSYWVRKKRSWKGYNNNCQHTGKYLIDEKGMVSQEAGELLDREGSEYYPNGLREDHPCRR